MKVKKGVFEKDFMKIKLSSDDNLHLNKMLKLHILTVIVRSVFEEDDKYYPQVFKNECLYELQMLEYDRIDFSEGVDINKRGASKECDICHQCYFLDKNFKQEPYVFNGCHDLMQKAMNFNDFAIVFVKGSDQRIPFWYMSNNDVINITKHSNLNEKSGSLQFFFYISKISGTTYYQRNRYVI